jgi:hypothetical protein
MRVIVSVLGATLAMLWLASGALAGGWAVTTLDPLPQTLHAGQTYRIGYVIRQHGVTPVTQGHPRIVITRAGEQLSFAGLAQGAPGHYVSEVTFPSSAAWTWSVDQDPFPEPQKLGAISVQPALQAAAINEPIPALKSQPPVELAMVALVALLLSGVALVIAHFRYATPEIREPGGC